MASKPLLDRIEEKLDLSDPEGCWLWTGAKNSQGYGNVQVSRIDGVKRYSQAHRALFQLVVGPVPKGLELDHLCVVPLCVNPDHLEPVTGRENKLRSTGMSAIHATKTHCPQGHPYDEENTYLYRGMRMCLECRRETSRRRWAKRKAEREAAGEVVPIAEKLRTHCAKGHPYDEVNTYRWRNKRMCKTCTRDRARAKRRQNA